MGHSIIVLESLFEITTFLLGDQHHLAPVDPSQAGQQGLVVAEGFVAMQLDELVANQLDVIECLRPGLVSGNLDRFPGIQVLVNLAFQPLDLDPHFANRVLGDIRGIRLRLQRFQLALQIVDRTFERKWREQRHVSRIQTDLQQPRTNRVNGEYRF